MDVIVHFKEILNATPTTTTDEIDIIIIFFLKHL